MSDRKYYSIRTGKNPLNYDLSTLLELFIAVFEDFRERDYFQEAFGFECVDLGQVSGSLGKDIGAFFTRKLGKRHLWPIWRVYRNYTEDDLFDVIEVLFDLISKPTDGEYHSWNNCGWHYSEFDKEAGREAFRTEMNEVLRFYGEGYELLSIGEITVLGPVGTETLLEAQLPKSTDESLRNRVQLAIQQYRHSRSSMSERRDAVRNLGDVLEFLRPQVKEVLKDDEGDLFNILNNFGIRHHNTRQKTKFEESIFLSWLFYHYLAAIHAALRLIEKRRTETE